jgi:hypothetical protein
VAPAALQTSASALVGQAKARAARGAEPLVVAGKAARRPT